MRKRDSIKLAILLILLISMSILAAGCKKTDSPKVDPKKMDLTGVQGNGKTLGVKDDIKFPEGTAVTKEAKVIIYTPTGNSENGDSPVLPVTDDVVAIGIDVKLENFDKDKDAYVFIDKKCIDVLKGEDEDRQDVELLHQFLTDGEKTIQIIQYENNDTSKPPVKFNEAKFKVKHSK